MPSASNNQSSTKPAKQTSVNTINSGGASGSKNSKKLTESTTKSNNTNVTATTNSNETSPSNIKTVKESTSNAVAAGGAAAATVNNKNWETSSAAGNNANNTASKEAASDALSPMKLTFTTIEHKIRNLEKRKTKLEGYRAIQASGKELSTDQRAAVAKYDSVIATIDFARDLVKQMQQFTKDAEKEQKKQARKDLIAKAQAETVKIREVLIIQNILSCLIDDSVRNDFLSGENGAVKLEQSDIEILDKFCVDVQTRRPETAEDAPFASSAQKAAEIFSMTIDARPKQYGDTTYDYVKRLFHRIQESDYLDKIYLTDVPDPETKTSEEDTEEQSANNNEDTVTTELNSQEPEVNTLEDGIEKLNVEGESVATTTNETNALDNGILISQTPQPLQQQAIIKEHLDMQQQQQQQQVALTILPNQQVQTPLMAAPMAPPATAVPPFQPTASQAGHSGATTPVHVALYHPSMQQPAPQQIPQLPPAGAIIGGVPTNAAGQIITGIAPQQQVGVQNTSSQSVQAAHQQQHQQQQQQQPRQILTSPASGQPGVTGVPLALHNANGPAQPPPPGHFNTAIRQHQQYLQQMRPLAEVIGTGNFYFLQDSELDSPDLNNQAVQGVPQNTIVFEQQQQQQQPQQNKPTQNVIQEQNMTAPNQQQQQPHQLQQVNQQLPLGQTQQQQSATQTPIQSQTFTNQSFPQMPPPAQQQQNQPPTNGGLVNSSTPSPLFQPHQQPHQQQQQQQQKVNSATNNQQLFSPVQNQNIPTQQQQQQQQTQLMIGAAVVSNESSQQQQQTTPALMMINRLAAAGGQPPNPLMQQQQQQQQMLLQQQITQQSQNLVGVMQQQLPNTTPSNNTVADMSQTPKNSGFPFENPVMAGLNYEQQMQTKLNAEKVLNALQDVSAAPTQIHKNELINEWDEAVLKSSSSNTNNQQDYQPSTSNVETTSNKWSAEVNANSPITVQQTSSRKNEWTSSTNGNNANTSTSDSTGGYGNDNRPESNHWHSQDTTGYGRGSSGRGQGGGANSGGYQRQRNDDRRDDRRTNGGNGGGGGGGGYRGRSNYGSGNPQQNGQPRGGGGGGNSSGIYFRNNENSNNTYYHNGSSGGNGNVYSNKDNRYDSRGGGGGNYRGPRGSDNNSANTRNNGPPPRHMGNRSSGGNSNSNNTNSNSYLNSRQSSNRMPLGVENKN